MTIRREYMIVGSYLLIVFLLFLIPLRKIGQIKSNSSIVNGVRIKRIGKIVRTYSSYNIYFSYNQGGVVTSTYSGTSLPTEIQKRVQVGMKFPVIYQKGHPENAYMLITKKDFERFGIPFPDSLQWLYKK